MQRYAVIGNPIAHSRSPEIHAAFARACGIELSYERVLAPLDGFSACIDGLRADGFSGVNVTVPFKLEAFRYAQEFGRLTDEAIWAGAVNTLSFKNSEVVGHNTDGRGLMCDIVNNLKVSISGRRVALLGAGGAARGALAALIQEGPSLIALVNRTQSNMIKMASDFTDLWEKHIPVKQGIHSIKTMEWFSTDVQPLLYPTLKGNGFDVVINATSSGLSNDFEPVSHHEFYLNEEAIAYEMMYGSQTGFMVWAKDNGARTADGWGMLVEQAAQSFQLWHGVLPDTSALIAARP